jgi:hypothetical protein
LVTARIVVAEGNQVMHALRPHVGEVHRRAGYEIRTARLILRSIRLPDAKQARYAVSNSNNLPAGVLSTCG